jgi:hypothetical protein
VLRVDVETSGFLVATKQSMGWVTFGETRSRDAASPEEVGLRNRSLWLLHVEDCWTKRSKDY